ncbi:MAG: response regulator, partial [Candidatus Omnitrophica bacterium]|nr:response regulator [Candidatus Omnitrophota bacterium]
MKKRILICDDEEGVRESLKLILEDDHMLTFSSSGDEALDKIRSASFDCLLLDIKMPTRDGLDTLEEVRKISPDLKVII